MADCLFCSIAAGEIPATVVHQTPRTLAFRDISPGAPTHVLIIPREHLTDAVAVAVADPSLLAELVTAAASVAAAAGIAESGYRLVFNSGPDSGQTVLHAHLHILGGGRLGQFGQPGVAHGG